MTFTWLSLTLLAALLLSLILAILDLLKVHYLRRELTGRVSNVEEDLSRARNRGSHKDQQGDQDNDTPSREDIRSLERICEIAENKFRYLLEVDTTHLERAASVITFGGIILSISFTIYIYSSPHLPLFLIGTFLIFGSLLLSLVALHSRKVKDEPGASRLNDTLINAPYEEVLLTLIAQFMGGYTHNNPLVRRRADQVNYALIFIVVGLFVLLLSALIN